MARPRQEEAKRLQIRTAAQALFLNQGFMATTTDAIAALAGVSKQTLYRYYTTKEALLEDVLGHAISGLPDSPLFTGEGRPAPASRQDLEQVLTQMAEAFLATLMRPDYLALMRVIIFESSRLPEVGLVFRTQVADRLSGEIGQLLMQARTQGLVDLTDVDAAVRLLVGALLTYVLYNGLFTASVPPAPPTADRIRAIVQQYIRSL